MKLNFAIPVVIGLSVGSLVLQLAGFVTPGWTIVEDGRTTYYGGVWYTVIHYPSITKTWLTSDLSHANNDIRYQGETLTTLKFYVYFYMYYCTNTCTYIYIV